MHCMMLTLTQHIRYAYIYPLFSSSQRSIHVLQLIVNETALMKVLHDVIRNCHTLLLLLLYHGISYPFHDDALCVFV